MPSRSAALSGTCPRVLRGAAPLRILEQLRGALGLLLLATPRSRADRAAARAVPTRTLARAAWAAAGAPRSHARSSRDGSKRKQRQQREREHSRRGRARCRPCICSPPCFEVGARRATRPRETAPRDRGRRARAARTGRRPRRRARCSPAASSCGTTTCAVVVGDEAAFAARDRRALLRADREHADSEALRRAACPPRRDLVRRLSASVIARIVASADAGLRSSVAAFARAPLHAAALRRHDVGIDGADSDAIVRVSVVSGVTVNACVEKTTSAVCPAVRRSSRSSSFSFARARAATARRRRRPSSATGRARRRAPLRNGTRVPATAPTSGPASATTASSQAASAISGQRLSRSTSGSASTCASQRRVDDAAPAAAAGAAAQQLPDQPDAHGQQREPPTAAENGSQPSASMTLAAQRERVARRTAAQRAGRGQPNSRAPSASTSAAPSGQ